MSSPVTVSRIQNRRGLQSQFNGLDPNKIYPTGYNGAAPGYGTPPDYNATTYPNVLQPGEIAFCLDTGNVYIGGDNGTFVHVNAPAVPSAFLDPFVIQLLPVSNYTTIPWLTYQPTPLMNIIYDVVDSGSNLPNVTGVTFSRSGTLSVTVLPGTSAATLNDVSSELNNSGIVLLFQAVYVAGNVEIQYYHNSSSTLTFSTSTIRWNPLA